MTILGAIIYVALLVFLAVAPGRTYTREPFLPRRVARLARDASDGVKAFLTWPVRRRRLPPRPPGYATLRIEPDPPGPRSRELVILGPGAEFTPHRPPAGPSTWAPAVAAAMPSTRCASCPLFGCGACREDTEPNRLRTGRYVPRADRCGACTAFAAAGFDYCMDCDRAFIDRQADAERLRFRVAMPQGERDDRHCGACDQPVRYFAAGEPPWIGHAVGCPRRSWPTERATFPRPGRAPRA